MSQSNAFFISSVFSTDIFFIFLYNICIFTAFTKLKGVCSSFIKIKRSQQFAQRFDYKVKRPGDRVQLKNNYIPVFVFFSGVWKEEFDDVSCRDGNGDRCANSRPRRRRCFNIVFKCSLQKQQPLKFEHYPVTEVQIYVYATPK